MDFCSKNYIFWKQDIDGAKNFTNLNFILVLALPENLSQTRVGYIFACFGVPPLLPNLGWPP